jgi:hypothetical protein
MPEILMMRPAAGSHLGEAKKCPGTFAKGAVRKRPAGLAAPQMEGRTECETDRLCQRTRACPIIRPLATEVPVNVIKITLGHRSRLTRLLARFRTTGQLQGHRLATFPILKTDSQTNHQRIYQSIFARQYFDADG